MADQSRKAVGIGWFGTDGTLAKRVVRVRDPQRPRVLEYSSLSPAPLPRQGYRETKNSRAEEESYVDPLRGCTEETGLKLARELLL